MEIVKRLMTEKHLDFGKLILNLQMEKRSGLNSLKVKQRHSSRHLERCFSIHWQKVKWMHLVKQKRSNSNSQTDLLMHLGLRLQMVRLKRLDFEKQTEIVMH